MDRADIFKQAIDNAEEENVKGLAEMPNRAEARRTMKLELKMMERKLGERGFGKRMCVEYGFRDSLRNRYLLTGKVIALMLERGEEAYFDSAD